MLKRLLINRWIQAIVLTALLLTLTALSFSHARWREQIRNFTFDYYNILQPRVASRDIVIVDLDEASQQAIGQWPWPRTVLAELVLRLKDMGAKVVTFDIVFPEEDRNSPKNLAEALEALDDIGEISDLLHAMPSNDEVFGEAIKEAGNVVTGFSFTHDTTDQVPRQAGIYRGKDVQNYVPNLRGASVNQKPISKYSAGSGSFFVSTDTDGIIRRVPMLVAHARPGSKIVSVYPSLSLETIRVLDGERGGSVLLGDPRYAELDPARFGIKGIEMGKGGREIPTNARGEFLVYFAPSNPDWYLSAHKILEGTLPAEAIKDKIVLIGTSAVGLKDIRSTPLNPFIPGVEVHLNIIDQVLQGKYLRRSFEAEGLEAVAIFSMGLVIILLAPFAGAVIQSVFTMLVIGGALMIGWYGFTAYGLLIDVGYPILALVLVFMVSTILTYIRTEAERRQVRDAFGLYISPDFMKELTSDPDKLQLGGEIKDLTVMFTDIRSFTTISEGLTPQELIALMNDFLTPMSDLVMSNRGTIDKYMGDAMMAFWNAPLDDPDHARHACTAALKMDEALVPINEQVKKKAEEIGKTPMLLNAGIGINTGPCAVGNMGSRQRFAYSTLGDAVNLASRLEGQTKTYGINILIGESTSEAVPDFAVLEMDLIQVKGKTKPVRVFNLTGDADFAKTDEFQKLKTMHNDMLAAYRAQEFKKALELCEACKPLLNRRLEMFYDLYAERADSLKDAILPKDWDGVFVATSK
ncbi:MAG: adenylate/guanylate cyclase domain-containing protein [Alphaproteobacteria bacterium]|nr:adenylate/guanylate cyclase domain-containing protein [Alphaproteobacteria bacterium]MCD8525904.1 adenylate/guanylate cyclase domain-containing protein [Alphaproteobacteria bacterium]MCD8570012.1 adenylate/guanylate cyclase domain-containing protein [Alphaproteobacteria bacterium]